MDYGPLQGKLGHVFANQELLRQALTHRSHSSPHNERIEFLGDGVLNCCIACELYLRFGALDEGEMSRVRANLVRQQTLAGLAQRLDLGTYLRLGEGELRSGGHGRPSILADALEAVFGAVFLDAGFAAAHATIRRLYADALAHLEPESLGKDPKTRLQELLQGRKLALPQYVVIDTKGAAHNQQFHVECHIPQLAIRTSGYGSTRRLAEQQAAAAAYAQTQE